MTRLSKNQSRALALALVAAVMAVVYGLIVVPYAAIYRSGLDRISTLSERLGRYRAVISIEDALRERLGEVEHDAPAAANFVDQETPALASAGLQRYIKQSVDEAGGRLISTQVLPADGEAELVGVTVKVGMRSNSESLRTMLYMLEGRQPIVNIDNLELRSLVRSGAASKEGDLMDIRFDLTGYLRPRVK